MEQLPSVNESRLEGDELDEGEDGEEVHDDLPEQPNQTSTSQRGLITKLYEWTGKNERWMFTQEQIERFRAQFYFFDKDKSGSVDVDELGLVFNQVEMDWTKEEIAEMVLEIDADQNGKIEFAEFLGLIARKLYLQQPRFQELREFFDYLDKDGNGIVSLDELQQLSRVMEDTTVDPAHLEAAISVADTTGKGGVDFAEFLKVMGYTEIIGGDAELLEDLRPAASREDPDN